MKIPLAPMRHRRPARGFREKGALERSTRSRWPIWTCGCRVLALHEAPEGDHRFGGISGGVDSRRRPFRAAAVPVVALRSRALTVPRRQAQPVAVHAWVRRFDGFAAATASRHGYPRCDRRAPSRTHSARTRVRALGRYGGKRGGKDECGPGSGGVASLCARRRRMPEDLSMNSTRPSPAQIWARHACAVVAGSSRPQGDGDRGDPRTGVAARAVRPVVLTTTEPGVPERGVSLPR